jgi:3-dehydroquinate dehydratase type I
MICVSISDPRQILPVVKAGAELLEFRLDLMDSSPEALFSLIPEGVKIVATCRPGRMGEKERALLLKDAVKLGAAYVDLEIESTPRFSDALVERATAYRSEVIFSYHDFEATPGREALQSILEQCFERGAAVAKVATQVNSASDVTHLMSLYELPGRKVVLGMGPKGRITRIAAPYLGAEFTFVSPGTGDETAPGQLTLDQIRTIYKLIGQP